MRETCRRDALKFDHSLFLRWLPTSGKKCGQNSSYQEPLSSHYPWSHELCWRSHWDGPCSQAGKDCCESCSEEKQEGKVNNQHISTVKRIINHFLQISVTSWYKRTWLVLVNWASKSETGQCRGFCTWELQQECSPQQSHQPWPPPGLQASVPASPPPI